MKLNNKGFTLVELLAVMVILISISLITVGSVTESLVKREEQECKTQMELAIDAAKIYCSLNSTYHHVMVVTLSDNNSPGGVDYFKDDSKIDMLDALDVVSCEDYRYEVNPFGDSCVNEFGLNK